MSRLLGRQTVQKTYTLQYTLNTKLLKTFSDQLNRDLISSSYKKQEFVQFIGLYFEFQLDKIEEAY